MSRMVIVLLLSLLLLPSLSSAQVDPDPDGIGIYFDQLGKVNCAFVPPGTVLDLYLVLTHATATGGIAGWECSILNNPSTNYIIGWYPVNYIGSLLTPPDFAIWCNVPLPWAPAVYLMRIEALIVDPNCWEFSIVPYRPGPSVPGEVVYADTATPTNLIPMHQSSGGPDDPVAGVNCDCDLIIGAERSSWGSVKSLYR